MPGKGTTPKAGDELKDRVAATLKSMGLTVRTEVRVGRRLWGARREIDVVATHPSTGKTLGIECKAQNLPGTAEEKIPATLKDMEAWPIPGVLVFDGPGFSDYWKSYLHSTGKALEYKDLEEWVGLYFGISDSD